MSHLLYWKLGHVCQLSFLQVFKMTVGFWFDGHETEQKSFPSSICTTKNVSISWMEPFSFSFSLLWLWFRPFLPSNIRAVKIGLDYVLWSIILLSSHDLIITVLFVLINPPPSSFITTFIAFTLFYHFHNFSYFLYWEHQNTEKYIIK